MEVSEIYIAPQGEGPNLGRLSLFLRTHLCNLQCVWCDSRQTWDRNDSEFNSYEEYTPGQLVGVMVKVARDRAFGVPAGLVITGGEPLLWQRHLPEVIRGYADLMRIEVKVEVETAGTIVPNAAMLTLCHFNCSPKLSSAGNEHVRQDKLWNADVHRALLSHRAIFKLVVSNDPYDQDSLLAYLVFLRHVADTVGMKWQNVAERVYLMPEGVDARAIELNQRRVIELAQVLGVSMTTRAHIIAWGAERRR